MQLSLEQQKRLAEIVYKDLRWEILHEQVVCSATAEFYPDSLVFKPELNGNAFRGKQALDVIVAALPLIIRQCGDLVNDRQHERFDQRMVGVSPEKTFSPAFTKTMILDAVSDYSKQLRKAIVEQDLLHAAALALLGDKT